MGKPTSCGLEYLVSGRAVGDRPQMDFSWDGTCGSLGDSFPDGNMS